jgi:hypothetical protein
MYDPFLYTLPLGMDQYFGAAESPFGNIKSQPMTYTESKRGKSTTTGTQRIIDAQGHQHPTF